MDKYSIGRHTVRPVRSLAHHAGLGKLRDRFKDRGFPQHNMLITTNGYRMVILSPRHNRIGQALFRHGVWEQPNQKLERLDENGQYDFQHRV